jgi:hypothetical protein
MNGFLYTQYFTGMGVTEDTTSTNPAVGDPNYITESINLPGTLSVCQAKMECVRFAYESVSFYYSVDLHWVISTQSWTCVGFFYSSIATAWTVADPDVGDSYGLSI